MTENTFEHVLDDAYHLAMTLTSAEGKHVAALLSQARSDWRAAPALDASRSWRFALIAAACVLVAVMLGGYIIYSSAQTAQIQEQARAAIASADARAEREYYRGVYDATTFIEDWIAGSDPSLAQMLFGVAGFDDVVKSANTLTAITRNKAWHKSESVGFKYPGDAPEASQP